MDLTAILARFHMSSAVDVCVQVACMHVSDPRLFLDWRPASFCLHALMDRTEKSNRSAYASRSCLLLLACWLAWLSRCTEVHMPMQHGML